MIPFDYHAVTLVHREETIGENDRTRITYSTHILTGCSFKTQSSGRRSGGVTIAQPKTTCRIPPDQFKPSIGDVLIRGEHNIKCLDSTAFAALLDVFADSAFKVASVGDNTDMIGLAHWVARSE